MSRLLGDVLEQRAPVAEVLLEPQPHLVRQPLLPAERAQRVHVLAVLHRVLVERGDLGLHRAEHVRPHAAADEHAADRDHALGRRLRVRRVAEADRRPS